MKTKPKPPVKLPKGCVDSVMIAHFTARKSALYEGSIPCAVLPCRTRKEAREIVRLHRMDTETMNQIISNCILGYIGPKPGSRAYTNACARQGAFRIMQALHLIP